MNKYLFTSERLGFRNWNDSDIEKYFMKLARMNFFLNNGF